LFWNAFAFPPDVGHAFAAVYRRVLPASSFFRNGVPGGAESYAPLFDKAAAGIRQTSAFDEPEQWQFDWERPYTRAEWLDTVPTFGGHSQFAQGQLDELLGGLGDVVDNAGGTFTMGYVAVVVTTTRRVGGHR
jgi:hypothetical protein